MADYNVQNHYSAKTLDPQYAVLYEGFKKHFGFSNKATIVLMAAYTIYSEHVDMENIDTNAVIDNENAGAKSGKVHQIRSGTDAEWNNFLNALILKLAKRDDVPFEQVFGDKQTYNKYLDEVIRCSYLAFDHLLENDLNSYKKGISSSDVNGFIQDALLVLKELEEERPF